VRHTYNTAYNTARQSEEVEYVTPETSKKDTARDPPARKEGMERARQPRHECHRPKRNNQ